MVLEAQENRNIKIMAGKPRLDLIPYESMTHIARAMEYGANIYGVDNWKKGGCPWRQYARAILSHTYKWLSGKEKDEESGISHLAHAAASAIILLYLVNIGDKSDDDR